MSIWTLIFGIIYPLIAVLSIRPIAGHVGWKCLQNKNKKEIARCSGQENSRWYSKPTLEVVPDWFEAYFAGFFLACFWPIFLLIQLSDKFMPAIGAEKMQRLEEENKKFREKEKELNLPEWELNK